MGREHGRERLLLLHQTENNRISVRLLRLSSSLLLSLCKFYTSVCFEQSFLADSSADHNNKKFQFSLITSHNRFCIKQLYQNHFFYLHNKLKFFIFLLYLTDYKEELIKIDLALKDRVAIFSLHLETVQVQNGKPDGNRAP